MPGPGSWVIAMTRKDDVELTCLVDRPSSFRHRRLRCSPGYVHRASKIDRAVLMIWAAHVMADAPQVASTQIPSQVISFEYPV